MLIKIVARICINLIRRFDSICLVEVIKCLFRFWAFSAAALLAILLFYWLYGGVIAFLLVCFGVSGVLYQASEKIVPSPLSEFKGCLGDIFTSENLLMVTLIFRLVIACYIIQSSRHTLAFLSPPPQSS